MEIAVAVEGACRGAPPAAGRKLRSSSACLLHPCRVLVVKSHRLSIVEIPCASTIPLPKGELLVDVSSPSSIKVVLIIKAYHTLRDRGLYPDNQVVKDLVGSFAFVVFDNRAKSVFAALSTGGDIPLYWGISSEGSVIISDGVVVAKGDCGKSFAPFPPCR